MSTIFDLKGRRSASERNAICIQSNWPAGLSRAWPRSSLRSQALPSGCGRGRRREVVGRRQRRGRPVAVALHGPVVVRLVLQLKVPHGARQVGQAVVQAVLEPLLEPLLQALQRRPQHRADRAERQHARVVWRRRRPQTRVLVGGGRAPRAAGAAGAWGRPGAEGVEAQQAGVLGRRGTPGGSPRGEAVAQGVGRAVTARTPRGTARRARSWHGRHLAQLQDKRHTSFHFLEIETRLQVSTSRRSSATNVDQCDRCSHSPCVACR